MRHSKKSAGQDKGTSQRQLRVGEEMRHALARTFLQADFDDPILHDATVTVTEVRVSPDLKNATAFVVPLGGGETPAVVSALNKAAGFFRGCLGQEMRLRYTPRLTFAADQSFDQADHIESILRRPRVRRDLEDKGEHILGTEDPASR